MNSYTRPYQADSKSNVGWKFIFYLALSNLGLWMAIYTPIQVLLPLQIESNLASTKEVSLGWATGIGALTSMLANPLFGALSDNTHTRWGRRIPWVVGGLIFCALSLIALATQTELLGITVAWCGVQLSTNAMLAALTAEVPDQVPSSQFASVSACLGICQPLGLIFGALAISLLSTSLAASYLTVTALLCTLTLPFVIYSSVQKTLPASRPSTSMTLKNFWIDPTKNPDFAWVWITRFLTNLGTSIYSLYLLFFLKDEIHYEQLFPSKKIEDGIFILILIYTIGAILGAFGSGKFSDQTKKRKIYLRFAALLMIAACCIISASPSWRHVQIACLLIGIGIGIYSAVGQAMVTETLPNESDAGKDLGLINIAAAAPQVLAPMLAAACLTQFRGYSVLYIFAAICIALGGFLLSKIKSVD